MQPCWGFDGTIAAWSMVNERACEEEAYVACCLRNRLV